MENKEKSQRQLAQQFCVSKSTIQRIKAEFDGIINSDQNHVKASKSLVSQEVDHKVFEIFHRLRNKNYPLNGIMLKRISLRISKKLNYSSFKASNVWLDKF